MAGRRRVKATVTNGEIITLASIAVECDPAMIDHAIVVVVRKDDILGVKSTECIRHSIQILMDAAVSLNGPEDDEQELPSRE